MTDEEKDIYNICLDKKSLYCLRRMGEDTCDKCKTYQMYRLGLTEGRKEVREHETTCINRLHHIEKENAELKEQLKNNSYVIQLQKEKAEMAEDFAKQIEKMKAETQIILEDHDTLNKWVDELREQIEKMKCCGNCKFFDVCAGDYLKKGFRGYVNELKQPCDKWEFDK